MDVMSYGLGNVGHRSIKSLMREFGDTQKRDRSPTMMSGTLYFSS